MKLSIFAALILAFSVGCAGKSKKMDDKKGKETAKAEMKKGEMAGKEKSASEPMASAEGRTNCMMKNDKRFVEVRKSGNGCELAYSKFGNEEIVATSLSGSDHCQKIADRIKGNLENAGFECKQ